jgi:hypothetical protein
MEMPGIVLSDASDVKTTLLKVPTTQPSSIEIPGIVLSDVPDAKATLLVILSTHSSIEMCFIV